VWGDSIVRGCGGLQNPKAFQTIIYRGLHLEKVFWIVGLRAYAGDRYQKFCCGARGAPRPGGSHRRPSACGLLTTTRGVCLITPQRQPGKFNTLEVRSVAVSMDPTMCKRAVVLFLFVGKVLCVQAGACKVASCLPTHILGK
jgi:hypothetical protein